MKKKQEDFSKLYDKYIDKIYRFIFIKVSSQEVAEDLCSETFLRCWEIFKKDKNKIENIQAFLYKIARNLVTDYYREKGRTQIVSADFASSIDSSPSINLEERVLMNSDLETIKACLTNLKENYQNVIICHYINDLSIAETAEALNKKEATVRVVLHRALKALKNEVKNTGGQA